MPITVYGGVQLYRPATQSIVFIAFDKPCGQSVAQVAAEEEAAKMPGWVVAELVEKYRLPKA